LVASGFIYGDQLIALLVIFLFNFNYMKSFKVRDLPAFILIALSFTASLLMGCSGGGGGGGSGSGETATVADFAPTTLTTGMKLYLSGQATTGYNFGIDDVPTRLQTSFSKILTVTSDSAANFKQSISGFSSPLDVDGTIAYSKTSATEASIDATNFPYFIGYGFTQQGHIRINLTFVTATTGRFIETSDDTSFYGQYTSEGEFRLVTPIP